VWSLGLLLCAASVSTTAHAQRRDRESQARVQYRLGRSAYEGGRFEEAAERFERAYALSQRPELLYNISVARRDAGQLGLAIDALRRYIELVPTAPNRAQLTARLRTLEQTQRQQTAPQLTTSATPAPPPPRSPYAPGRATTEEIQPRRASARQQHRSHSRAIARRRPRPEPATTVVTVTEEPRLEAAPEDAERDEGGSVAPWIAYGIGGALIAAGAVTGILALEAESDLEGACPRDGCPPGYEERRDEGETLATATDVLIAAGVVSIGVGVTIHILSSDSDEQERRTAPRATASCTTHGCRAALGMRF